MSKKYLGDEIDIHAGGEDLIFPHHENEIAQSEAANGKIFSRYWMHNAFLMIDNKKMAKSLGNFKTVRDVNSTYDPQVLRYVMLQAHYRSPLNFSAELMEIGKSSLERMRLCARSLDDLLEGASGEAADQEKKALKEADSYRKSFEEAMDDDLNTADAISAVFELVRFINSAMQGSCSREFLQGLRDELFTLTDVLGLKIFEKEDVSEELTAYVEARIEERKAAKKARDFAEADRIRDELLAKGIILEDTREGVKWRKA